MAAGTDTLQETWLSRYPHVFISSPRQNSNLMFNRRIITQARTCELGCVLPPFGGYLSLMAGNQLAWHRLAKERTSKMPKTQPHTPSSSSKMKLYSGHSARHGPRHLGEGSKAFHHEITHLERLYVCSLQHTPVSDDVRVGDTGLFASLDPQVKLPHHPIHLQLNKR